MKPITKILVPIDFSETSTKALDYAIELAKKLDAKVTVMHAYEIPVFGFPDGAMLATADIAGKIASAAKTALESVVAQRAQAGTKLDSQLRTGIAWEEVNTVANELDADLIVIGTHGRRGLARALLGSVAENVIRTSTRPVLAIRGPHEP